MTPTEPATLTARIQLADQTRRPDLLPRKYAAMRQSAFRFFRATPYLFYADWLADNPFQGHPLSWVCADLHLENMGSYRADNGLIYFDVNDFDEACLAPGTVDLARLLTSLFVAAPDLSLTPGVTQKLAQQGVNDYCQRLLLGKPRSIERETATGVLRRFLTQVAARSQKDLLDLVTRGHGKHRRIRTSKTGLLALPEAEKAAVWPWLAKAQHDRNGSRLLDVALRLAGTSSLALNRYLALVETETGNRKLIDVKAVRPSVVAPYWPGQPAWPTEATRVVTLQHRLQDVSPGGLHALLGPTGEPFVAKNLQPQSDRINLSAKHIRTNGRLERLLGTVAQLTASAHLRSGGQQGSAITDELMAFAANPVWAIDLLDRAEAYANQVRHDYRTFCSLTPTDLMADRAT